jgi:hypothetical protein
MSINQRKDQPLLVLDTPGSVYELVNVAGLPT